MKTYKDIYRVESVRLKDWDYTSAGWYFATICTRNQMPFFGEISAGEMHLSPIGQVVAYEWQRTERIRSYVSLDEWVIMPNHLHGIIVLHPNQTDVETSRLKSIDQNKKSTHQNTFIDQSLNPRDVSTKKPRLQAGSLGAIIGQIKSVCTKRIRSKGFRDFGWQARYYDHIIRDNEDLDRIREYIPGNPYNWDEDVENPANFP
jgi:REP element-mobilizing transposase RayT